MTPDPGQSAYQAHERAFSDPEDSLPWGRLTTSQQRKWAQVETEVLALETLPASGSEQQADAYLARLDRRPRLPDETAALAAVAHAILGLCDLARTVIANG